MWPPIGADPARQLFLCEKESQAASLAEFLGCTQKHSSYFSGPKGRVGFASGHLLEQFNPDDYDEKYKSWDLSLLPIRPPVWKNKVAKGKAASVKILCDLISSSSHIVIATDFGREGELIARELMERARYRGEVFRLPIKSLNDDALRNAFAQMLPGSRTEPLYYEALARSHSDWSIGMNLSRLFTKYAESLGGGRTTYHVGRVSSSTIRLLVDRQIAIDNFKAVPYYTIDTKVTTQNGSFSAKWVPPEDHADPDGRCLDPRYAQATLDAVNGQAGVVLDVTEKTSPSSAPLPFDLSSLQRYANARWGMTSQETLSIAQQLYEKKILSYPRTEFRYFELSMHPTVPGILQAVAASVPAFEAYVAGANASIKGRAFNDQKVGDHHAIAPTTQRFDYSGLSPDEKKIYDIVARFFLAQFYAPAKIKSVKANIEVAEHTFSAAGQQIVSQGWKMLFQSDDAAPKEDDSDDEEDGQMLPPLRSGEPCRISSAAVANKETKPLPAFTEATLLGAMSFIARYVDEPEYKAALKASAGIGTAATRHTQIENIISRGYVARVGKKLVPQSKAFNLIKLLPSKLSSPGFSGFCEQQLARISKSEISYDLFMKEINDYIDELIGSYTRESSALPPPDLETIADGRSGKHSTELPKAACPKCGETIAKRKGKYGLFWPCSACGSSFKDVKGKPFDAKTSSSAAAASPKQAPDTPPCPLCSAPTRLIPVAGKTSFYGCTMFRDTGCKGSVSAAPKKRKGKASYNRK